jgi:FMN reductase
VFSASEDFGSTSDGKLADRIDRAAAELASMVAATSVAPTVASVDDRFEDPVPFEELPARQ